MFGGGHVLLETTPRVRCLPSRLGQSILGAALHPLGFGEEVLSLAQLGLERRNDFGVFLGRPFSLAVGAIVEEGEEEREGASAKRQEWMTSTRAVRRRR